MKYRRTAELHYRGTPLLVMCRLALLAMAVGCGDGERAATGYRDASKSDSADAIAADTRRDAPVTCLASDACHDVGIRDSTTGTCSNPAKVEGATYAGADACFRAALVNHLPLRNSGSPA